MKRFLAVTLALLIALTCSAMAESKPATEFTVGANQSWYNKLDFSDASEQECALRGLIEAPEALVLYDDEGNEVWNVANYSFVNELETAPDTVNPSLWRNTLYNQYAGLFEVCDGIYQVRGYDMANATFIRTDNGWIVFDVLMCTQDMAAAKALMEKHFGKLDIKAVLYSHSHVDHYGGILGLMDREDAADASLPLEEQLKSGKVVILAPEGFLEHAVSENIYCNAAMSRRAMYQYGVLLEPGPTGKLAMGIGLGQAVGNIALVAPTCEICSDDTVTIDGLEIPPTSPGTAACGSRKTAPAPCITCTPCAGRRCGMPSHGPSTSWQRSSASGTKRMSCSRAITGRTGTPTKSRYTWRIPRPYTNISMTRHCIISTWDLPVLKSATR